MTFLPVGHTHEGIVRVFSYELLNKTILSQVRMHVCYKVLTGKRFDELGKSINESWAITLAIY